MTPQEGVGDRIGRPDRRSGSRGARAGVPVTRHPIMLVLAGLLVLASTSCDPELGEGDLVVDNRTDTELTIYGLHGREDPSGASNLSTVRAGTELTIPGTDGCSRSGFEARDPDGTVIAEFPPVDPDEHDCKFTWVVTDDDSYIEQ